MIVELFHTGVAHDENPPGRGSGRYAWGSGEKPNQHRRGFLVEYEKYKAQGMKDKKIAEILMGAKYVKKDGTPVYCTGSDLKVRLALEKKRQRENDIQRAKILYEECDGNKSEAARRMGIAESTYRNLLNEEIAANQKRYQGCADMLKKRIAESEIGAVDISKYAELYTGMSEHTMRIAVSMLEEEGYTTFWIKVPLADGRNETKVRVLARKPEEGETSTDVFREVQQNKYKVSSIVDFTSDGGETWWTPEYPESISSKRIMARYDDDPVSGSDRDGVIQIRRGVKDLSLGDAMYAQVRIAVDGTHYMKGMAVYGDDSEFPPGVDIIYNTNKKRGTPLMDSSAVYDPEKDVWSGKEVLKRMKMNPTTGEIDKDNPFGATIRAPKEIDGVLTAAGQYHYVGADGNEHLSPINKLREEGDWSTWSKTLASQMLSKQPSSLVKEQTTKSLQDKDKELNEIMSLTNPVLKKKMLEDYADNTEAKAAELSTSGFNRQRFQVLLPVTSLKDNEIYAPNFKDGEEVALVRYPHGGVFEMPVLKVNNKNPEAKSFMLNAKDAVGINSHVASILSGADYDGDTALVIPTRGVNLRHKDPLKGLDGFDPKVYKLPDDAPPVTNATKQLEMGKVTNLITDMSLHKDCNDADLEKGVKHSMVVIDSEKHHLNYKQSEIDNDILALKYHYQGTTKTGKPAGASTIVSRAGAETYINERKEITDTKKMTPKQLADYNMGKKVYVDTGEKSLTQIKDPKDMTPEELTRYNAGKRVFRETDKLKQVKIEQMYTVDDAYELVRDKNNPIESAYADYANGLKQSAWKARATARQIQPSPVSPSAKAVYAPEVKSLDAKLNEIRLNKPKERQALYYGNALYDTKIKENPNLDKEHRDRLRAQCMDKGRSLAGSKKPSITFTDKEWEAIQAGAISSTKQSELFQTADQDHLRKRATPRNQQTLSTSDINLIKIMKQNPKYTNADIAERVGCSVSLVNSVK